MAEDLILVLDDDTDLILETETQDTVFVDDVPHADHPQEYTGDYEVYPSLDYDIELPTQGKLMTDDLTVKALPTDPAAAEITGTNTVTPMASLSGSNVTLGNTDTGISVTAVGGGTASASATATATDAGFVSVGTVLDTATLAAASATTSATSYIQSIVVPSGKLISVTADSGGALSVGLGGNVSVGGEIVVASGAWAQTTPTAYGTYYGKVVVGTDILQAVYPVGSLYATETSTDNPATILGFGTWTQYAPADMTWNDTDLDWNNTVGTTEGVYVWKRTA